MDAESARAMNTIFGVAIALGAIVGAVLAQRPASGYRRAEGWAYRARLVLDPAPLRLSIVRRFRAMNVADSGAGLVTAVVAAALLATPLADSELYLLTAVLPTMLLTSLAATVAVGVRERLFDPAPDAPRVARLRTMTTSDYLGRARCTTTWILAAATIVALGIILLEAARGDLAADAATLVACGLLVPLALCAGLPRLERAILTQSQPASNTLELAWDDALRSACLASIRLSAGVACLVGVALAVSTVWVNSDARLFAASQIIVWGQVALQSIYPLRGFRLRPSLRPTSAVTA